MLLKRCVTYSDSGLTWEVDLMTCRAGSGRAWIGLQAARPQTSPGPKPSAPRDHEELELDGQKAYNSVSTRLAYLAADRPDIAFAPKECSRADGKATFADFTRLECIGRYYFHTPRAVWEFPLQTEESIVTIDGLSDAGAASCTKTRRSDTWSLLVTEQRGIGVLQHHVSRCELGHRVG